MSSVLQWLLTDLALAALVLAMRRWLWLLLLVKGNSMQPTLRGGEWVWASRIRLKRQGIRRGDIVICYYPGRTWKHCRWIRQLFIKRVIGLPGETISIEDGVTMINGEPLSEPYLDPARCRFRRQMAERQIGPDEVFVMGDHRSVSHDCRSIGPLKQQLLVGIVTAVLWRPK